MWRAIVVVIFSAQRTEGGDVDFIFEIPPELARHAIDFRDEDYLEAGKDVDVFITAEPNHPAKRALFHGFWDVRI